MNFSEEDIKILHHIAYKAIEGGMSNKKPPLVAINQYPEQLTTAGATFVTVKKNGMLRGCIGSLIPHRPLILDINNNAYAAAFEDPRFEPVTKDELKDLDISISILSKPTPIEFTSEKDLISQLIPYKDGLILEDMGRRGTFLPSVWDDLKTPELFLAHLKNKAGLPQDHWSSTLKVYRYHADVI